jgi:hypothetical protein
MLEAEGIATVMVSLVSSQSQPAAPPRVLWVPFELGRPMGAALEADFQREVLRELLMLFDVPRPPQAGSVLAEFARDAPAQLDEPSWCAPALSGATSVAEEISLLAPAHAQFVARIGRSTAVLSGLDVQTAAEFLSGFDAGIDTPPSVEGMSDLLRLRFAVDDLKAYYLEAASAAREQASSRQLHSWLWQQTRLGTMLKTFRRESLESDDQRRETVGGKFIVPRDWLD